MIRSHLPILGIFLFLSLSHSPAHARPRSIASDEMQVAQTLTQLEATHRESIGKIGRLEARRVIIKNCISVVLLDWHEEFSKILSMTSLDLDKFKFQLDDYTQFLSTLKTDLRRYNEMSFGSVDLIRQELIDRRANESWPQPVSSNVMTIVDAKILEMKAQMGLCRSSDLALAVERRVGAMDPSRVTETRIIVGYSVNAAGGVDFVESEQAAELSE